ncbi:MAG: glycoside hydrolase family 97 protein [Bacteroidota bacterium]
MSLKTVSAPKEAIEVTFGLSETGRPYYTVSHENATLIDRSYLGFSFKEALPMMEGFEMISSEVTEHNSQWEMPWGEQRWVENHYTELQIVLREILDEQRQLEIIFRVYDDGIGFRYRLLPQENRQELFITEEHTEFNLTDDHNCCWQPGDWDSYEHLYNETPFSKIDALSKRGHPNLLSSVIPENAVNTPITMKTHHGVYLSFHEAAIYDYPGMTLRVHPDELKMTSALVASDRMQSKARIPLPFITPWRTIQISQNAGGLIESNLIVNLNEPNKLGKVDYFTPMKYLGVWWEMHIGKSTWDIEGSQDMSTFIDGKKKATSHGATTQNTLRYIDFAADHGIKGLLVEGWNTGWDQWINTTDREGVFDFMTPYPDYDFDRVMAYARERGVEMIMHHETSAAPRTYEIQMDEAYDFMKKHGMNQVKTGYVGAIIPKGEYHHGQWMVQHYQHVLETAAKKRIAVNAHEPIKASGKRRTYPNAISREGLRGQEFNAWAHDGGNPPDHLPKVAFTRMLGGPIDYTPGVFNIKFNEYKENNQVNTTLCHQLALYVVIYSPIQMVCDLPEHYLLNGAIHPAFQFIKDVGVDWEQSKVLEAEIGDVLVMARQEKDTPNWFVGGISDEHSRSILLNFSYLEEGKSYKATLYRDHEEAHWNDNPEAFSMEELEVDRHTTLSIKMAAGGGFAMSLFQK